MLFEPNDNMNTIHLGNYEEFFVLYMDNELSEEQVKMVDEFLVANPDLRAEFEILMGTKLPVEEFSFDKNELLAENMKLTSVDEELLLYIDNELSSDKKRSIEVELAFNKEYQLQHQLLVQARLDPAEQIPHPNKKELYRRAEKVIAFRPWMRIAAAVMIIAIGGMFYFRSTSSAPATIDDSVTTVNTDPPVQRNDSKMNALPDAGNPSQVSGKNQVAVNRPVRKKSSPKMERARKNEEHSIQEEPIVAQAPERPTVKNVQVDELNKAIAPTYHKDFLNTGAVTYLDRDRTIIKGTPEEQKTPKGEPAIAKGSVKGFLRKATRMIEKRTGFDPTNENGELLIGAVAISLK